MTAEEFLLMSVPDVGAEPVRGELRDSARRWAGGAQTLGVVCLCASAAITFVLAATAPDQFE